MNSRRPELLIVRRASQYLQENVRLMDVVDRLAEEDPGRERPPKTAVAFD